MRRVEGEGGRSEGTMRRAGARVNLHSLSLKEKGGEGTSGRPVLSAFSIISTLRRPLLRWLSGTYRSDSTPHAPRTPGREFIPGHEQL